MYSCSCCNKLGILIKTVVFVRMVFKIIQVLII